MLFELLTYFNRNTIESYGGYYYVIQALNTPIREDDEERREEEPYWVMNLACAAA